jgi:hypothetical protein
MYTLPVAGPSFIGHIAVVVFATVVTFGKGIINRLLHKNV